MWPRKVAWLNPVQGIRSAYHVWLSETAAEYIDRRETLAALDTVRSERDSQLLPESAAVRPGTSVDAILRESSADEVWIDYVADIGDSLDATYAVLNLLVTPNLSVRGSDVAFNPGHLLILGGDLIYPTPSRDLYLSRTRAPLLAARPSLDGRAPCLFAIPGNHDWYDGLTNFYREFCQGQTLGGWSMLQRRSYFAIKLAHRWWLWGIDIALDTTLDPPQQSYFLNLLRRGKADPSDPESFLEGDNIILCTAKPAWLDESCRSDGYRNLAYFIREIIEKHGGRVRVVLAGDLHHYNRYENASRGQLITAGGGGAYLSGTHRLPDRVQELYASPEEWGLAGQASSGGPNPDNAFNASDSSYPSRSRSRLLALRTLFLAFRPANWLFTLTVGALYWLLAWVLLQADTTVFKTTPGELMLTTVLTPGATPVFLTMLLVVGLCIIVAVASESTVSRWRTIPWGLGHGVLHLVLAVLIAWSIDRSTTAQWKAASGPLEIFLVGMLSTVAMIGCGGLAGATLVGIYFVLSDRLLGWHANEVFAAQSIIDYRSFLRLRIDAEGTLTIFPIGLRKVPRKWRPRHPRRAEDPFYEPADRALDPHLIEGPIMIRFR